MSSRDLCNKVYFFESHVQQTFNRNLNLPMTLLLSCSWTHISCKHTYTVLGSVHEQIKFYTISLCEIKRCIPLLISLRKWATFTPVPCMEMGRTLLNNTSLHCGSCLVTVSSKYNAEGPYVSIHTYRHNC